MTPTPLPQEWFVFETPAGASRHGMPPTRSVVVDGREIPYRLLRREERLQRPVLVLLYGMGLIPATFWGVAPYLFETHDLLLVDYNSFSAPRRWPAGGVGVRLLGAGVWKAIDAAGCQQVSLLGSSLGGGLAILCTQMAPARVRRLVLINPAVYPQDLPQAYRLWRVPILGELLMAITPGEKLIEGVAFLGYSEPEKMPSWLREVYTQNMASYRNRLVLMDVVRHLPGGPRERADHVRRLGQIRQPTLVIWGAQERLLPLDTPARLARDLPAARVAEFADLAHLPHDEAPERVGPVIAEFLAVEK